MTFQINNEFSPLKIVKLKISEITNNATGFISKIQLREIDGVIVEGFFTNDEVRELIDSLPLFRKYKYNVGRGETIPIAYYEADTLSASKGVDFSKLMVDWKKFRDDFHSNLSYDIENRILATFENLQKGVNAFVPQIDSEKTLTPFSIRNFYPDKEGIPIHCGNMFEKRLPTLYSFLQNEVNTKNQMSFFATLKNSTEGGDLTIYNLYWEAGQVPIDDNSVKLINGDIFNGDDSNSKKIRFNEGDLFIFAAGEIWHRVENPKNSNRYTLGGFLSFTYDRTKLAVWS